MCPRSLFVDTNNCVHNEHHPYSHTPSTHGWTRTLTDFASLIEELRVREDRGIIAFVAPPWGAALDEVKGLDLGRTKPPSSRL